MASSASEPEPEVAESGDQLKLLALQLRSRYSPGQLEIVFEYVTRLGTEGVTEFGKQWFAAADTGSHGPIRTDVCTLCGQSLPKGP